MVTGCTRTMHPLSPQTCKHRTGCVQCVRHARAASPHDVTGCIVSCEQTLTQSLWEFLSSKGRMMFAPRMDDPRREPEKEYAGVDNASLTKFVSSTPGLLRSKAFKREVDLVHARHKETGKRTLTRSQLGKALVDVAIARFGKRVTAYRRARDADAQTLMLMFEFVWHVRCLRCAAPLSPRRAGLTRCVNDVVGDSTRRWGSSQPLRRPGRWCS